MILTGKVAVVTGASSGIGQATALALIGRGVYVAALARSADGLASLTRMVENLPTTHGNLLVLTADVRDAAQITAAVDQAAAHFGRLDIVIANAGVGQRGALMDAPWEDIETVMRTNIDGVLHTLRAAVPHLRIVGGGHLVIVSSVVAPMITPFTATYSASKAYISSIARALRYELAADRIGVTDLLVGRTTTAFNQNRLGIAGYAARAPRLPAMSAEQVAAGIIRAVERNQGTVTLRPFDQVLVWASRFVPHLIARRAMKQYK